MGGVLDNIISGGASTAIGAGMGMLTGGWERGQAERQNQEMINQQVKASKELTSFNREQQMQMWNDTNYNAQVKQMKKAGLNTGLIYGMSGGGGATAQVSAGSSPSGGAGAGRNDTGAGMSMMLQNANLEAQRKLIEAQTKNVETDTETKGLSNTWEQFIQNPDKNQETDGTPLKERAYRLEQNEHIARIRKLAEELNKIGIDVKKGGVEIEKIKSDTALQEQLHKFKEEMNPEELRKIRAELDVFEKNPANNEIVQWFKEVLGIAGSIINIKK